MDTCETCRFREPDARPDYAGAGNCHRYPPTVAVWTMTGHDQPSQPGFEQHWPWMPVGSWCGEHKPKGGDNGE